MTLPFLKRFLNYIELKRLISLMNENNLFLPDESPNDFAHLRLKGFPEDEISKRCSWTPDELAGLRANWFYLIDMWAIGHDMVKSTGISDEGSGWTVPPLSWYTILPFIETYRIYMSTYYANADQYGNTYDHWRQGVGTFGGNLTYTTLSLDVGPWVCIASPNTPTSGNYIAYVSPWDGEYNLSQTNRLTSEYTGSGWWAEVTSYLSASRPYNFVDFRCFSYELSPYIVSTLGLPDYVVASEIKRSTAPFTVNTTFIASRIPDSCVIKEEGTYTNCVFFNANNPGISSANSNPWITPGSPKLGQEWAQYYSYQNGSARGVLSPGWADKDFYPFYQLGDHIVNSGTNSVIVTTERNASAMVLADIDATDFLEKTGAKLYLALLGSTNTFYPIKSIRFSNGAYDIRCVGTTPLIDANLFKTVSFRIGLALDFGDIVGVRLKHTLTNPVHIVSGGYADWFYKCKYLVAPSGTGGFHGICGTHYMVGATKDFYSNVSAKAAAIKTTADYQLLRRDPAHPKLTPFDKLMLHMELSPYDQIPHPELLHGHWFPSLSFENNSGAAISNWTQSPELRPSRYMMLSASLGSPADYKLFDIHTRTRKGTETSYYQYTHQGSVANYQLNPADSPLVTPLKVFAATTNTQLALINSYWPWLICDAWLYKYNGTNATGRRIVQVGDTIALWHQYSPQEQQKRLVLKQVYGNGTIRVGAKNLEYVPAKYGYETIYGFGSEASSPLGCLEFLVIPKDPWIFDVIGSAPLKACSLAAGGVINQMTYLQTSVHYESISLSVAQGNVTVNGAQYFSSYALHWQDYEGTVAYPATPYSPAVILARNFTQTHVSKTVTGVTDIPALLTGSLSSVKLTFSVTPVELAERPLFVYIVDRSNNGLDPSVVLGNVNQFLANYDSRYVEVPVYSDVATQTSSAVISKDVVAPFIGKVVTAYLVDGNTRFNCALITIKLDGTVTYGASAL